MREDARRRVLRSLPGKHREHLERLLRFREQTAGALMESRLLTLMPDETAAEAIGRVRADASRVARHLYVVDRPGRLAGVVSLKELLAAADDTAVAQVMNPDVTFLRTGDSLSAVLVHPAWIEHRMLPVVDDQGLFAGVLLSSPRTADVHAAKGGTGPADQAAAALGELYRVGISALVDSAIGATLAKPGGASRARGGR